MSSIVFKVRKGLFFFSLLLLTASWAIPCIITPFLPRRYKARFAVVPYCKCFCWAAKVFCGHSWRLTGLEHLTNNQGVILSNHQSAWETFFIPLLVSPQTQVLKKELLNIPIFGWCFRWVEPIAIDRSQPKKAMQKILRQGSYYLNKGFWVLIFPEGTRHRSGGLGKFARGGAMLAHKNTLPVIPIAHNSGQFFFKKAGCISVVIGPPIYPEDKTVAEINEQARLWITSELEKMD